MLSIRQLKIITVCALIGLESVVFFNSGFFDRSSIGIIGGADGPTKIFISGNGNNALNNLFEGLRDEMQRRTDSEYRNEDTDSEISQEKDIDQEEATEKAKREAEGKGLLILVNKQNPVDEDYKPEDLEPVKYYAADRSEAGRYMRAEAAEQFHRLVEAAEEDGFTLVMTTAYRSYGFQRTLWDNYVANEGEEAAARFSARPGQSEHQTGLAVDVSSPAVDYQLSYSFGETEEGIWLAENSHRFGFVIRYPEGKEDITGYLYEPWHIRYVGEAVATEMYKKGLTLEEYLQ